MAMKEVRVVIADLEARVVDGEAASVALNAMRAVYGIDEKRGRGPTKKGRGDRAAGAAAMHERVLAILKEAGAPMKPAAIVVAAKAPEWPVKLAIKELVADGKVIKAGATLNRTYALAKKGGAK